MMDELIRFFGIDFEVRRCMERELWPLLEDRIEPIIGKFYDDVRRSGIDVALSDETVDHLKIKQKAHWRALFTSRFDQQYRDSASLVGIKHYQMGVDPRWYIAGYTRIKGDMAAVVLDSDLTAETKSKVLQALDKYVALDMALAISSYTALLVD
jgi:hypothetical protein